MTTKMSWWLLLLWPLWLHLPTAMTAAMTRTIQRQLWVVVGSLHWLWMKQWVDYKLATLVCKSLQAETPSYLVDDCRLIADSGRPQLHSAHANVLTVPRTNTRLSNRSFSVAGPSISNSLPASLWQHEIELGHFKQLLKAFLFGDTTAH